MNEDRDITFGDVLDLVSKAAPGLLGQALPRPRRRRLRRSMRMHPAMKEQIAAATPARRDLMREVGNPDVNRVLAAIEKRERKAARKAAQQERNQ